MCNKEAKFEVGDQVRAKETGQEMNVTEVHKIYDMDTNTSRFSGEYTCSFVKYGDDHNTIGRYNEDQLEEIEEIIDNE